MPVFVIADTHLSLNSNKPMDVFGFKWLNYVERLEYNWRESVGENDHVVIAGDVSWGMTLAESEKDFRFLSELPGKKYILKGNHDYWWATMKKLNAFFNEKGFTSLNIVHNNAYLCENIIVCGSRGWFDEENPKYDKQKSKNEADNKKILARESERLSLSIAEGKKIHTKNPEAEIAVFLHYPPIYDNYKCSEILDVLERENIRRCYYGHIHTGTPNAVIKEYKNIKFDLISADFINFTPILIN